MTPNAGPSGAGGEQEVVIAGSGFTGVTDVQFGGTDVTTIAPSCPGSPAGCFTVVTDTEIDAGTPVESSGTVHVIVTGGSATGGDEYSYVDPPTVTNVDSPQPEGATRIAVTGSNFSDPTDGTNGVSKVQLNPTGAGSNVNLTTQCSSGSQHSCFTFGDDADLTINLPASMTAGAYDTIVTAIGGPSTTSSSDLLTVGSTPTLTNVNPSSGPIAGGNQVILTGTEFTGATNVNVGGLNVNSSNFTVDSDTQITIPSFPSHAAGGVPVSVDAPDGTSNTQTYTYDPLPTLTNVNPSSGPIAGGNQVILTGTDFTGATNVKVGTLNVSSSSFTVNGPGTQITIPSFPGHAAGGVLVSVDTPDGTSNTQPYTYDPLPTLTNVNPSSGPVAGGNQVILTGTDFTGATNVNVGTLNVGSSSFTVNGPGTQITIPSFPGHAAGGVLVSVDTPDGTSNTQPYTYDPLPTLTNLNPSSGPIAGGNQVVLTGTDFTGATNVNVGTLNVGSSSFTVNGPGTQITIPSFPAHAAGGVAVSVDTPDGTSSTQTYTYVTPPTLTNLNPPQGPTLGGNSVMLTGTDLSTATDVNFGASDLVPCPSTPCFTVNSNTSITVSGVPAHGAGPVSVNVVTAGGTTGSQTYTYATLPTVTSVFPSAGPAGVVTSTVTLTGTAFESGSFTTSDVFFGALDITTSPCLGSPSSPCFTVNSPTQIVVQQVPAHAAATVDITVQTPLGTSAVAPPGDTFAWAPVPTVTSVSPNNGSTSGGIAVVVTGTGFASGTNYSATSVHIGATLCAVTSCYVVDSPTQMTIASIPAGAGGQDDITVTNIAGTSAPNPPNDVFTYIANLPTVSSLSPSSGATSGLAIVTITGTNYGSLGSGFNPTAVTFGGRPPIMTTPCPSSSPVAPCFTRLDANRISVATPSSPTAGSVNVTVTTGAGTSNNAVAYTYIAPGAYTALTPYRVCDTRAGGTHTECSGLTLTGSRHTVTVQITGVVVNAESVPAGAQAVVVNLTAINHSAGADFISAFPSGAAIPNVSNINIDGGQVQANLAVVALSTGGAITVYNPIGSVDVLVDVEGYFATPTGAAGTFHTFPPVRICDTRAKMNTECATTANQPLGAGKWRDVVVSGLPPGGTGVGIPADGTAASAVLNLTAVGPTAATFLSVAPPNSSDQCPTKGPSVSNLNPKAGETEPNRVISPLGPHADICVFNGAGSVNFIIDINGWFGTGAESTPGAHFYAVPPTRICDTRTGSGTRCAGKPLTKGATEVVAVAGVNTVPAFTTTTPPVAIVANLTAVAGTANTFFLLYPSDAAHRPGSSDLNPSAKDVIANLAVVSLATTGVDAGEVDLYNAVGTINALLDVAGWFQ